VVLSRLAALLHEQRGFWYCSKSQEPIASMFADVTMGNNTRAHRRVTPDVMTSTPREHASRPPAYPRLPTALDYDRRLARAARIAVLALVDVIALIFAGGIAYAVWALPIKGQSSTMYLELVPLFSLFVLGYALSGLYPGLGLGPVETLRRQSYVTAFGFLVLAAFSFALKLPHLYSRATFAIALVLSLIALPLVRAFFVSVARRWQWWNEPVVIIGAGERVLRAINHLRQQAHGYAPAAVLQLGSSGSLKVVPSVAEGHSIDGVPVMGSLELVPELAARGIRIALVTSGSTLDMAMTDELQRHFRHVILLREYDDLPVEGIQIRALGALVGIEYTNNLLLAGNRAMKRALDLIIASMALVITSPIVLIASLLVRVIDGAPAFFMQSRAGVDGHRISVPKIRTMKRDAEETLNEVLTSDTELRAEWEMRHKLKNDPRLIAGVGKLFRRFSVDELPQLWSVLRGDMSLVGPRPFPDYHLAKFSPSFRELRQRVQPGITGLWQVEIRSEGSIAEQEALDSYYIRNWSVWLDLYVLGRTVAAVAAGKGAY
jgi:Undecaprenyl-phosphate galactose phosphotransferase WbaP